jgi:hypothetical protein
VCCTSIRIRLQGRLQTRATFPYARSFQQPRSFQQLILLFLLALSFLFFQALTPFSATASRARTQIMESGCHWRTWRMELTMVINGY